MKKISKKCFSFIIITIFFCFAGFCSAGPLTQNAAFGVTAPAASMGSEAGFRTDGNAQNLQLATYLANIIKVFLTLLGVIFTILIIIGGYTWMTAGGSEDKVQKAKDTIQRSVIGFFIVLSAYAITYFVFKSIASGGTNMPG